MADPHSSSSELAYLSAQEVISRFESGSLTSTQLVTALIERIQNIDLDGTPTSLHSIAAVHEEALSVARERDDERARGISRGALHGVPVIIKDNIEAVGLPGLAGSTSLIGRPTRDAPLVVSLKEAGAIILASTNLSEWANILQPGLLVVGVQLVDSSLIHGPSSVLPEVLLQELVQHSLVD